MTSFHVKGNISLKHKNTQHNLQKLLWEL